MKHEVLTRAIGELDDELIADAYAYKPRKRYALPRFLAAAACLVLVLAAALAPRSYEDGRWNHEKSEDSGRRPGDDARHLTG